MQFVPCWKQQGYFVAIECLVFSSHNVRKPSWNMELEEDWEEYKIGPTEWVSGKKVHPAPSPSPLPAPFDSSQLPTFQDGRSTYEQIQEAFARHKMPTLQATG